MHFSEIVLGILLGWYSAFFFVEFATAVSRELGVKAVPYTTFLTNIFMCKIFSTPQDVPYDSLSKLVTNESVQFMDQTSVVSTIKILRVNI